MVCRCSSDFLFLLSFIHALFLYNMFTERPCYLEEKTSPYFQLMLGIGNSAANDKQLRYKTQLLTIYWLLVNV